MTRRRRCMRAQRGLTLIEVLIAFVLLFVVTLAVLTMFSLAAAVNQGSFARTDMAYAAEKVVEVIRVQQALSLLNPPKNNACCPLTAATANPYNLPSGSGCNAFWGAWGLAPPGGTLYDSNARYTLSYTIVSNGTMRQVTVTAQPTATGYIGMNPARKAVRYVAQLPGG